MPDTGARRRSPHAYDFEGAGDEARQWLDRAYGTTLRLTGRLGAVRHHRDDHGCVAFDHVKIDARFAFDSDPMPALVVVDMLTGHGEYTRDRVTDRIHDGQSVLIAGWGMPVTGTIDSLDVRATSFTAAALTAAVDDVAPDYPWQRITFSSYVPVSQAAGARWRAVVDQLSSAYPDEGSPVARGEATRLLGHTLLHTFPNNVVAGAALAQDARDARDGTTSALRRALRVIEERAAEDLSLSDLARVCGITPRSLQYAFRRHLGCTPSAYLRRVRLDLARQSLRDGSSPTVSDAATRFGFFNPGRFASHYREVFHENPHETLQRFTT